ncbi:hypothetical protein E4U57_006789 [Claviceps arundinis]|uniref:Uncharacterized protein n=1 Tax=Claviceps arundinis TaxID=1623583 RepID=A0ABQ7P1K7_9HYPO|nr:hypothetical protein E4U57_006789 [Claviceps arundinis]
MPNSATSEIRGLKWKQCSCAQWDENRLIARVCNIMGREYGGHNATDAARDALAARTRQNLIENHESATTLDINIDEESLALVIELQPHDLRYMAKGGMPSTRGSEPGIGDRISD